MTLSSCPWRSPWRDPWRSRWAGAFPDGKSAELLTLTSPVAWRGRDQVGAGDISAPGLEIERQPSSHSHSTAVRDNGNSKQLKTGTLTLEGSFSDSRDNPLDPIPPDEAQGGTDSPVRHPSHIGSNNTLATDLRAACVDSKEGTISRRFLPVSSLDQILTLERIKQELARLPGGVIPSDRLDEYAMHIKEPMRTGPKDVTSRRQIFAILALLEKPNSIVDFIDKKLYDCHLPLVLTKGKQAGSRYLSCDIDGVRFIPDFFLDLGQWPQHLQEQFERYQWEIQVPYFELSTKQNPHVNYYELKQDVILPIMESGEPIGGGFGEVRRVKFHRAHHNYCQPSVSRAAPTSVDIPRRHC